MMRWVLLFSMAALAIPVAAQAQIMTTVAGNGTGAFCGDGGPATAACLWSPTHTAVDIVGRVLIADLNNHRIRRVDAAGTITTVAGNGTQGYCGDGGPASSACLSVPTRVTTNGAGELFIADAYNWRVRKIDADGTITTVAGNGTPGYCGDGGPATGACLSTPGGLAVDSAGNLFITDVGNNRVRKVDTSGTITTVAGNGTGSHCGDNGPATSACLNGPIGIAVSTDGVLFIADLRNHRVRRVDAGGTITTVAGTGVMDYCGDGGAAKTACLAFPYDVALDDAGNLFVADHDNHRVRVVNPSGTITTIAGNGNRGFCGDGPATTACLNRPTGVAIDAAGALFIADSGNERIRKVDIAPPVLQLSKTVLSGCLKTSGKVTLTGPAPPGGTLIALSSDNVHVSVPQTVRIGSGKLSKVFSITTSAVAGVEAATIEASAFGRSAPGETLTLTPIKPKSVTLSPDTVVGGTSVGGMVTLECPAGPGDIVVTLSSSKPAIASPSAPTVTVPSGATTATFSVTTAPVATVTKPAIKATANGATKTKTLIVTPMP